MNKPFIKSFVTPLFKRGWVIYAVVFLVVYLIFDVEQAVSLARLKTLNRIRPEAYHLGHFIREQKMMSDEQLEKHAYYYQKVIDYIEPNEDAYAMLGFCVEMSCSYTAKVVSPATVGNATPNKGWPLSLPAKCAVSGTSSQ